MHDQEDPKTIGRYLLGELPPEEMNALEARLLTESGLFELAETVEDEVIDRYVRGELSAAEKRRFERRLLPSERIRERVAFARALADRESTRPELKRRSAPVIPLFRSPARLAWAATLVACLAAGTLGFEVFQLRDRASDLARARTAALEELAKARRTEIESPTMVPERPRLEDERDRDAERLSHELRVARDRIAELEAGQINQQERQGREPVDLRTVGSTKPFFVPPTTRGGGAPTPIEVGESEKIELQLELGPVQSQGGVVVTVLRGGQPVWRDPDVKVTSIAGESMVSAELPSKSLLDGRYRIELAEGATGELVSTYEISVSR